MEAHSVRRKAVDWGPIKANLFNAANKASSIPEIYPAIQIAVKQLGDHHSFFLSPTEVRQLGQGRGSAFGVAIAPPGVVIEVLPGSAAARAGLVIGQHVRRMRIDDEAVREVFPVEGKPGQVLTLDLDDGSHVVVKAAVGPTVAVPEVRLLAGDVGYVNVPGLLSTGTGTSAYAESIQRGIARIASRVTHGWIVDLRRNWGGNMWPMIAGLGPLLRSGTLGDLGQGQSFSYSGGASRSNGHAQTTVTDEVVLHEPRRVAVLTSHFTGSSGEATALAFRAQPRACTFGQPTFGDTSANQQFAMPDGAGLWLSVDYYRDRLGNQYTGPMQPDVRVAPDWGALNTSEDRALRAATAWLRSARPCS